MADDKDILGKADALLRRHGGPQSAVGADATGVPVLTDLFETAPAGASDPADGLAREIHARVLAEVENRLAADLESRIARELAPQIQAAIATALRGLHQELAAAVGSAVAEAIKSRQLK